MKKEVFQEIQFVSGGRELLDKISGFTCVSRQAGSGFIGEIFKW